MGKILMGPQTLTYPMPIFLIGANVDDKPNFMTIAWCGMVCSGPPMISVATRRQRHTCRGIRQNLTFSVNIPSTDMVVETDYCGLKTGSEVNKVEVCQFKVFYGKLGNAPLIEQCPVNVECAVVHTLDLGNNVLIVGRVEETHISESCITDGKPDISKIKPLTYMRVPTPQYQVPGEVIAKALSIGEQLKARE